MQNGQDAVGTAGQPGWALATVAGPDGPLACIETGGALYRMAPALARAGLPGKSRTIDLFDDWDAALAALTRAAAAPDPADRVADGLPRLAPILYPGKVLCAGANYFRHLAEMGMPGAQKADQRLFFFFKPSRNAVVGEGATVHMPLDTEAFDWEVELAAVIGRTARAVTPEQALSHVAGYTVAVDFCARDLNRAPETFYKLDWVAGKAQESCCPLGPRFVPAAFLPDPQALRLSLSVNGETRQDDTTADMIFSIAEQIAIASRIMTLDPGDVLLTGTPAGVGAPKGTFLSVGDRTEAAVQGIGTLTNIVQPPKTSAG
jgi:2-keto-4-pentenoate hydratase/2-oxohepta-3-ene-1,7-dioic acid hydratase in catechol pathway